jgi:hypothetical protein
MFLNRLSGVSHLNTLDFSNKFIFLPWPRAITRRTQSRYGRDALDQT